MNTDPNCIFCKMIQGEITCAKIYEDDSSFAFLDIRPINAGHTLLLPKNHEDHLWDLDSDTYHYLFNVAKKIKDALNLTYSAPRVGMILEGFGVAHAHLHILPIYSGDDIKKSQPEAKAEDLELEAQKIKANL